MKIEVLYIEGCPNHSRAMQMVQEALESFGRKDRIHEVEVRSQIEAQSIGFVGSPSIRINGSDIELWARAAKSFGLSCRSYLSGAQRGGVPSPDIVRCAILEGIREGN